MDWRHSGSPRPKLFLVQKSTGNVLSSIFWDQGDILLIHYLPKGQTINAEYYCPLLVHLKDILKGKRRAKFTNVGLVLARQFPGSPGTCNPEETGLPGLPFSWSHNLFSGSGPVGLPPVLWTEKQWKGHHFSSDAEVIASLETGWTGNNLFFFEWLAEFRATG